MWQHFCVKGKSCVNMYSIALDHHLPDAINIDAGPSRVSQNVQMKQLYCRRDYYFRTIIIIIIIISNSC